MLVKIKTRIKRIAMVLVVREGKKKVRTLVKFQLNILKYNINLMQIIVSQLNVNYLVKF